MSPILKTEALRTWFPVRRGLLRRAVGNVRAVDGVDLHVEEGETLGIVGESGCGKSTLVQTILRLIRPTEGRVFVKLDGELRDVFEMDSSELRQMRRQVQIVFQDPSSSLSPRLPVKEIVAEPLRIHGETDGLEERVSELLEIVGLRPTAKMRFARSFSGGQKQRVGIARALALRPRLLILDEPVSALDVSVQAQILNLLKELKSGQGLTYLFIAHNLDVVRYMSDRVAVMYLGRIVEIASAQSIYRDPQHPYTESLLSAIPALSPEDRRTERHVLEGDLPDPAAPPPGCPFHTRCPYAEEKCIADVPALREIKPGHSAACHFSEKLDLKGRGEAA